MIIFRVFFLVFEAGAPKENDTGVCPNVKKKKKKEKKMLGS